MEECYFTKINIYIQHLLNIQEVFTPSTGANLDVISKRTKPKYTRYLQSTMPPNLVSSNKFPWKLSQKLSNQNKLNLVYNSEIYLHLNYKFFRRAYRTQHLKWKKLTGKDNGI